MVTSTLRNTDCSQPALRRFRKSVKGLPVDWEVDDCYNKVPARAHPAVVTITLCAGCCWWEALLYTGA